ncbi:Crp/Fnr family transcriptional regulator [Paenibacillus zanthoxyli]|uniref:Crp/Fnr family transcriptional regulator n=1 Tax=Paenibacillus zanthoxyli TaxID=369399 RepID=UPI0004B92DBF|nr:Crp/Fnr family transcriptional regulator [Paenibacillus zanthoxyli]
MPDISSPWEMYLNYGTRRFYKGQTMIFRQGEMGEGFYYLHRGLVKIMTSTAKGNDRILNIMLPGKIAGINVLDRTPHIATAITVNDSVLYYFSVEQMVELMNRHPDSVSLITQTAVRHMRVLTQEIVMDSLTAEQRIAYVLLKICHEFREYQILMTQDNVVNCTGLTRITVYKILKKWVQNGMVDIKQRKVIIQRPDLLKKLLLEKHMRNGGSVC